MIQLSKSQGINLSKSSNNSGLKEITFGLGWTQGITKKEVVSEKKGLFSKLFSSTNAVENRFLSSGEDVDLDATVLAFDKNDNCVYECSYRSKNIVFAHSAGDDTTGNDKKTESDNEQIKIYLNKVPSNVERICLIMNIYNAYNKNQNLSMINKAYCNVYDDKMNVIAQYQLDESYGRNTGILVGELVKDSDGKFNKFTAIGEGYTVKSIDDFKNKISR